MKRLIVCADGTWNDPDEVDKDGRPGPTNVTKIARVIAPRSAAGIDQVVLYHDGVGTRGAVDHFTGGAFGEGIERNIRDLYRFVVYNWAEGDEIYFFGFSRGAFTVRSLAGFMKKIGLIKKDDDCHLQELYDCYEQAKGPGDPEWDSAFQKIKDGQRVCPPIKFIGVWDTVGALGAAGFHWLNPTKYKYHDIELNDRIENAYQALAVDERRRPFKPSLWQAQPGWRGKIEQAWFAGVHSNVGGGYDPDGLANEALHWMIEKAGALGLEMDTEYLSSSDFQPCFNSVMKDSMTAMYKLLGPIDREVGNALEAAERVHQSVLDRLALPECHYAPASRAQLEKLPVVTTASVARGTPCA
jgi:uncharacterized protein (DUF2235 family)